MNIIIIYAIFNRQIVVLLGLWSWRGNVAEMLRKCNNASKRWPKGQTKWWQFNVKKQRSKTKTSWRKSNKNNKNSCQKWLNNKNKKYYRWYEIKIYNFLRSIYRSSEVTAAATSARLKSYLNFKIKQFKSFIPTFMGRTTRSRR